MQDVKSRRFIELLADRTDSVLRIEHHEHAWDVVDFLLLSELFHQPLKKTLLIRLSLSLGQALPGNELIFQLSLKWKLLRFRQLGYADGAAHRHWHE